MTPESFLNGKVELWPGDCLDVLARMEECSIDSVVTDPPYHLTSIVKRFGADGAAPAKVGKTGAYARASVGFMGKQWDGGDIAFRPETWTAVWRVLKPGGHLVAFSGTRTYHRMVCAIEDAGFEIRDQLAWTFASGFPKSHDVSKGIDKAAGAERKIVGSNPNHRAVSGVQYDGIYAGGNTGAAVITVAQTAEAVQWEGWGTALKPAWEPIVLARKPLSEPTIAANVLRWGTGALNIEACRIATDESTVRPINNIRVHGGADGAYVGQRGNRPCDGRLGGSDAGRWPANLLLDGSEEVLAAFPETTSGALNAGHKRGSGVTSWGGGGGIIERDYGNDSGSAARFFYTAKADAGDRIGSRHPTVKPVDLMQWLVRLVTPRGGIVLDCFAGTGTTAEAAFREGMRAVLIEREPEYQADIRRRMSLVMAGPEERERESIKAAGKLQAANDLPLFSGDAA